MNTESPTPPPAGQEPLFWGMKLNLFCMVMYLACFASVIIPFAGIVLPIIMWLTNKEQDASGMIDRHGKNILNFLISMAIYGFASFVLCLVFIGFLLLPVLAIFGLAVTVMAAVKANEGTVWPVPFCIRFFK